MANDSRTAIRAPLRARWRAQARHALRPYRILVQSAALAVSAASLAALGMSVVL